MPMNPDDYYALVRQFKALCSTADAAGLLIVFDREQYENLYSFSASWNGFLGDAGELEQCVFALNVTHPEHKVTKTQLDGTRHLLQAINSLGQDFKEWSAQMLHAVNVTTRRSQGH